MWGVRERLADAEGESRPPRETRAAATLLTIRTSNVVLTGGLAWKSPQIFAKTTHCAPVTGLPTALSFPPNTARSASIPDPNNASPSHSSRLCLLSLPFLARFIRTPCLFLLVPIPAVDIASLETTHACSSPFPVPIHRRHIFSPLDTCPKLERAALTSARRRRHSDHKRLPAYATTTPPSGMPRHPLSAHSLQSCHHHDDIPPPRLLSTLTFLSVGQTFSGSQTVNAKSSAAKVTDEWRVNVVIQGLDLEKSTICGSMEALDVPKAVSPVVTFWEGEIIDNRNYFFWTGRWDAQVEHDVDHWQKFIAFAPMQARVRRDRGDDIDLSNSRYLFMRWKEIFFVSPGEDCGLTIAGFYYICMDRQSGAILGYYYDPHSQPYQRLQLSAVSGPTGHSFGDYEFN